MSFKVAHFFIAEIQNILKSTYSLFLMQKNVRIGVTSEQTKIK
jgi:hypothetical protein